ncbi:MAG TPA: glycine cleavage system aminomethyltransferase GcvT [Methylomirabilota bacterium]|jgi:aminomethyltransferase|nr:glycine cleavage system aminomethyltransferase GcvT [Methylomirabilota bacterium]
MRHTPLFDRHVRDASVAINLKGFARGMHYGGHIVEHRAVREAVSLCDVSHMGEIDIEGPDALALVQKLITNDARPLEVDQALYSVMCDESGTIIDDLVCYRLAPDRFLWVVNVTKTDEDYGWVLRHARGMEVTVKNVSTDTALLALQGPESREVLQRLTKADLSGLRYYRLTRTIMHTAHAEVECMISRTGYTGERGYEIMVARDLAPWVWDELLLAGRPLGIVPHGVAARESLRTEAGYLLNGNDMDAVTNPFEAGLGWVVKLSKDFIGKKALQAIRDQGVTRTLVGIEVEGRHVIRYGYGLYRNGAAIGRVTSGPLSPSLTGRSLGLGYVSAEHAVPGTAIEVDIRGTRYGARVAATPFRRRRVREEPAASTYSPYELRYSPSHVWARRHGREDVVTLGLSDFGQRSLGDILFAELPRVGDAATAGTSLGWLDSYRRPFDIVSPVTGEVVAVDGALPERPEHINAYPYARAGLVTVRMTRPSEYETLMSFEDYAQVVARLTRYDEWSRERRTT